MKNPRKYKIFYRKNLLSCCCRHIKTTAEIRENDFDLNYNDDVKEYRVKIRRGRSRAMLPTTWDDLYESRWETWKSWKSHSKRPKQWIPLNEEKEKPKPLYVPTENNAIAYEERDRPHNRLWNTLYRMGFFDKEDETA